MTKQFKTNLRCESCVAQIKPILDADPAIHHWSADVAHLNKVITVEGDVTLDKMNTLLGKAGYQALGEVTPANQPASVDQAAEPRQSYFPLLLILLYLLGIVGLIEYAQGTFHLDRAMRHFMAGFFLVFSFFKMLNLTAFADAYMTYDVVARRSRLYGYIYPFIELLLGLAYLINFQPMVTNIITLVVMAVSSIGVIESLINKRKIRCACLGTVFNLPMSVITLVEDTLMVAMAAFMLWMGK